MPRLGTGASRANSTLNKFARSALHWHNQRIASAAVLCASDWLSLSLKTGFMVRTSVPFA
jgi:hypothetical protein